MSEHYNQLNPGQAERLAILLEELGEAQQAIGKILRHGLDGRHPKGGATNRQSLERELGDIQAAIDMLHAANDLDRWAVNAARVAKHSRIGQWTHHQRSVVSPTPTTRGAAEPASSRNPEFAATGRDSRRLVSDQAADDRPAA